MNEIQMNGSCINIAERGAYIIQELKDVEIHSIKYVLWNKTQREHVTIKGDIALFDDKEKATEIAKKMSELSILGELIEIPFNIENQEELERD